MARSLDRRERKKKKNRKEEFTLSLLFLPYPDIQALNVFGLLNLQWPLALSGLQL
jgi:hypothetical protein